MTGSRLLFDENLSPRLVSLLAERCPDSCADGAGLPVVAGGHGSSAHTGKGKDRSGQWSLRINDQWHVCFEWRDDISVNQFIASAAAEKMASVLTFDDVKSEAAQGKRSDFEHYLGKVPDVWAQEGDEAD